MEGICIQIRDKIGRELVKYVPSGPTELQGCLDDMEMMVTIIKKCMWSVDINRQGEKLDEEEDKNVHKEDL